MFKSAVLSAMWVTLMAGTLGACAGQQSQDENLEATQQVGNQGDLGKDDAADGNGQENLVQDTSSPDASAGADVNSVTTDDTAQLNATLNGGAGDALAGGGAAAPLNAAAPVAPTSAAPAMPAASGPAAGGEQAPVAGGRVRYVKEGGVQVVNAPGGSPVFTLEQGDHPVTWEENGWLKLTTGMYVPVEALSDQGVGRPSASRSWMAR